MLFSYDKSYNKSFANQTYAVNMAGCSACPYAPFGILLDEVKIH